MNQIEVSVIIPAYNVENYIRDTIMSCVSQVDVNHEIIVVNDGSKDNTLDIINTVADSDGRIKILDKPNGGVTSAREEGAKIAQGKFIFFLDGDDKLSSEEVLHNLFEKAKLKNADFVAGDFWIEYPDGTKILKSFPEYDSLNSKEAISYALKYNDFYYTGRLIKRNLINGLFGKIPKDITYGEDNYAVINLLTNLRIATKVDFPVINYVQRPDSVTNRLSVSDFIKRNKATQLTLKLAEEKRFEEFARQEVLVYALRELAQSIRVGVPNREVGKGYLKKYKELGETYKKELGKVNNHLLKMAYLNFELTVSIVKLLRKLKK